MAETVKEVIICVNLKFNISVTYILVTTSNESHTFCSLYQ